MNRDLKFRAWNGKKWITHVFTHLITNGNIRKPIIAIKSDEDYIIKLFTGLYDRKNNEIYEGDIVKREMNNLGRITISYFEVIYSNGAFTHYNELNLGDDCKNVEVVGNIFENPELLTKKI